MWFPPFFYFRFCHRRWSGIAYRHFWATVRSNTIHPMLQDHSPVWPLCSVGILWPSGWMDQDATWYKVGYIPGDVVLVSRPQWKGTGPLLFRPYLLWLNGRQSQQLLISCYLWYIYCGWSTLLLSTYVHFSEWKLQILLRLVNIWYLMCPMLCGWPCFGV